MGYHADSEFMGMHAELACQIQRGVEEKMGTEELGASGGN